MRTRFSSSARNGRAKAWTLKHLYAPKGYFSYAPKGHTMVAWGIAPGTITKQKNVCRGRNKTVFYMGITTHCLTMGGVPHAEARSTRCLGAVETTESSSRPSMATPLPSSPSSPAKCGPHRPANSLTPAWRLETRHDGCPDILSLMRWGGTTAWRFRCAPPARFRRGVL
jgi:hypothetical protein